MNGVVYLYHRKVDNHDLSKKVDKSLIFGTTVHVNVFNLKNGKEFVFVVGKLDCGDYETIKGLD